MSRLSICLHLCLRVRAPLRGPVPPADSRRRHQYLRTEAVCRGQLRPLRRGAQGRAHREDSGHHRRLGFDYIFDTNFTADLTIMEEGNEFLHRLKSGDLAKWPMFTSCCPGGCVGGGGQPISAEDKERYGVRGQRLYDLDRANPMRFSHENPDVQTLYSEFLGQPLSEKAEELLHTDHMAWNMPNQSL